MLVEHTFVTTYDGPEAMRIARELLVSFGFVPEQESERTLQLRRGIRHPAYAENINQLPQSIVMEFDRGRVTVAAFIQEHRKPTALHNQFVTVIAQVLERLLANREKPMQARQPWDDVQKKINVGIQKVRRWRRWILIILIAVIASLGGMCIWAINTA